MPTVFITLRDEELGALAVMAEARGVSVEHLAADLVIAAVRQPRPERPVVRLTEQIDLEFFQRHLRADDYAHLATYLDHAGVDPTFHLESWRYPDPVADAIEAAIAFHDYFSSPADAYVPLPGQYD